MGKITEVLNKYKVEENLRALIELPAANSDQEIFDRLMILQKAGIEAASGARSAHTDILVNSRDKDKAIKVLKRAGIK